MYQLHHPCNHMMKKHVGFENSAVFQPQLRYMIKINSVFRFTTICTLIGLLIIKKNCFSFYAFIFKYKNLP